MKTLDTNFKDKTTALLQVNWNGKGAPRPPGPLEKAADRSEVVYYVSAMARFPAGRALASFLRYSLLFLLQFSVKKLEKPRVFRPFPFTPPHLNQSSVGFHKNVSEIQDIKAFLSCWLIKPKFLDTVSSGTAVCPLQCHLFNLFLASVFQHVLGNGCLWFSV